MGLFSKKTNPAVAPESQTSTAIPTPRPSMSPHEKSEHPTTTASQNIPRLNSSSSDSDGAKPSEVIAHDTEHNVIKSEETALDLEEKAALEAVNHDEDEIVYPTGVKLGLIVLALCLSVFLMAIDNTIIATAIPKITDQFNSLGDIGWYASAYLLTTCALQLFFGKLYTFYSIKYVFLTAIFIFEVGSAVCGSAPSSKALIVGRAIAGIGSSGIFSGALVIIAYSCPLEKRPVFTGLIGAMYGIASVAGPLLGGAFTDGPGWPWCFYINLPLGAITILVIIFFFQSPTRKLETKVPFKVRAKQLDLGGLFVFVISVVCLLLALQWGGSVYPWRNWRIIVCLVVFAVGGCVWAVIQYFMGENATVPLHIIKQRNVIAACAWAFLVGAAFFVLIYWLPIWFQAIKDASAFESGIRSIPMVLSLVLANILAGVGTQQFGYPNPFYYASVVLASIGAGLLTTFQVDTGHAKWIGYQVIYGLGVGFGMQQSLITIQTVLPLKDIPIGTAIAGFLQTFGGALFASVAQNIFNNKLIHELPKAAPGLNPYIVVSSGATDLASRVPQQYLSGVKMAYNEALTNTWYISVGMSVVSVIPALFVQWKSIKGVMNKSAKAVTATSAA